MCIMSNKFRFVALIFTISFALASCARVREDVSPSIFAALSERDDGVISVDIDLQPEQDQVGSAALLAEGLDGRVGYQLANTRGVVSEFASRRSRGSGLARKSRTGRLVECESCRWQRMQPREQNVA